MFPFILLVIQPLEKQNRSLETIKIRLVQPNISQEVKWSKYHFEERLDIVTSLLERVGLNKNDYQKYIHEFSGGQRQRIAIARSLILKPKLIILDEAVSALDVSIRAQILDLLVELSESFGLSYLFISHDLSLVKSITSRVLVMQSGEIVETGKTIDIFNNPSHQYTKTLIESSPNLEKSLRKL